MQELPEVMGMVIKCEPYGEYDRRVVLLTKERGKITCFAKGARKVGSRFMAATNPFAFGTFKLYEGRSAYSLNNAEISEYFELLRDDLEKAYYGMYFLEVADYYTRENNDEKEVLKLLYLSIKALVSGKFDNKFVRSIFEIKLLVTEGEYPGIPERNDGRPPYNESTIFALNHISTVKLEKLYTFMVSDEVLSELMEVAETLMNRIVDRKFKSLEFLTIFD